MKGIHLKNIPVLALLLTFMPIANSISFTQYIDHKAFMMGLMGFVMGVWGVGRAPMNKRD